MSNFPNGLGYGTQIESHVMEVERRLRLEEMQRAARARQEQEFRRFLNTIAEAMRPVIREEIRAAMPTKSIGSVDKKALEKGKVKPVDKTPAPLRKGKAMKAERTAKGLKQNREKRT